MPKADNDKARTVSKPPSLRHNKEVCFNDGVRKIDYVLVIDRAVTKIPEKNEALVTFVNFLKKQELQLEIDKGNVPEHIYVKVHCPRKPLNRYAVRYDVDIENKGHNKITHDKEASRWFTNFLTRNGRDDFERQQREVTSAERIYIVRQVLTISTFPNDLGMNQLLSLKLLKDAYPLHDGDADYKGIPDLELNDRQLLAKYWGNFLQIFKMEPVNLIEKYYGAEIAFYHAFSNFYGVAVKVIAILGLIAVIFSHMTAIQNRVDIEDICNAPKLSICPVCHSVEVCPTYQLKSNCKTVKLARSIDSSFAFTYSIIVCFWAVIFMKLWQRHENVLKIRWNVTFTPFNTKIRPEYLKRTKFRRMNKFTNELEPYVPLVIVFLTRCISGLVLFLWFLLSVTVTLGLAYMRATFLIKLRQRRGTPFIRKVFRTQKTLKLTAGVALLNLVFIKFFTAIHQKIVVGLTIMENRQTQTDFDESVLYKSYAFEFINYFMTLLYSAFLRGSWYHPMNQGLLGMIDIDVCHVAGCMITITGNVILFILSRIPVYRSLNTLHFYLTNRKQTEAHSKMRQFEREYFLKPIRPFKTLFDQTELMIQYSLITFVPVALPLGPLLVWVINRVYSRLDAYRLVKQYRRPAPIRQCGIGEWNGILSMITLTAAIVNPLVSAFATQMIPKQNYLWTHNGTLKGFVYSKLSVLDLHDIADMTGEDIKGTETMFCYYLGRNYPPGGPLQYKVTTAATILLGTRVLVVIIFEHFVFALALIIGYFIPTLPQSVKQMLESQHRNEEKKRMEKIKQASQNADFMRSFIKTTKKNKSDDDDAVFKRSMSGKLAT